MKMGFLWAAFGLLLRCGPASAGAFSQLKGPEEQLALLSSKAGLSIPADATPLQMLRIVFAANQGKALPAGLKARYVGDGFLNSDEPLPADTLPFPQGGADTVLNLDKDRNELVNLAGVGGADKMSKSDMERLLKESALYSKAENKASGTFLISYADAPYPGGFRALELRQAGPFVVGVSRRDDMPESGGIETYFLFYKRIDRWALFPAVLSGAKDSAKALQK